MLVASLVLLASLSVATAQTAAVDAASLAQANLVGQNGEVINDAAYSPNVGVQLTFVDKGFDIGVLPGVTLTRNRTFS